MVVTDLLIKAKNGTDSFKYYPIAKNIPINLNFALADVREPDKRKASFSKTIELFGTNEINKLFENIFSFNVATQSFNKNLKSPCKYIVDGIENFSGDLQLLKVNIKPDNSIVYECSIVGDSGSIFVDIGDKLIIGNADSAEDLDFSSYDHQYTRTNQIAKRANVGTGTDCVYPFVNKGSNSGSDTVFNVTDFLPCFSLYEYIKKIIEATGRTFTSTFLESSFFKHLIVYPNMSSVALNQAQVDNKQWYAGLSADYTPPSSAAVNLAYDDTATAPFFDLGSQSSGGGLAFQLNKSGAYNIAAVTKLKFTYSCADANVYSLTCNRTMGTYITKNGSFNIAADSVYFDDSGFTAVKKLIGTDYFATVGVATGSQFFAAGDYFRHYINNGGYYLANTGGILYYNSLGVLVTPASPVYINVEILGGAAGSSFYGLCTQKLIIEKDTMYCNNALPTKIKQKDLLKSTMMAFNLFLEPNPDDANDLIIEPFNEFYNTLDVVNFENRTDLDKDQTVNPNILDGKRYIYSYKEDKDYYNTLYKTNNNEVFGTEQIDVENDFIKADKKTELIFSPTPNVANYGLGIAHPMIYAKEDSGIIKALNPNIRLLYCDSVKQSINPYTYTEFSETDLITSDYLYAGHTDDPFNPTLDLNFGFPKEVYYSYPNAYFTDNNLYNAYHKQYLTNLIDRDGKFVTKYLWLSPKDIYNFSFRNRIFVDGAYYIVNKIENYNPIEQDSTKCELIKLLDTPVFTPTSFRLSDTTINTGANILTAKLNNSLNVGDGIQNKGTNCTAIGNNIIIPASCSNVTVIGNNVTVSEGVSNSSVISTNDFNLTESNYSITNNVVLDDYFVDGYYTTTDATPSEITFNTPSALFDLQGVDCVVRAEIRILAVDIATGDCKEWKGAKIIKNISGTTSTNNIETVVSVYSNLSMVTCTANMYDDATPQSIEVGIVGVALTTIEWKCYVNFLKIVI